MIREFPREKDESVLEVFHADCAELKHQLLNFTLGEANYGPSEAGEKTCYLAMQELAELEWVVKSLVLELFERSKLEPLERKYIANARNKGDFNAASSQMEYYQQRGSYLFDELNKRMEELERILQALGEEKTSAVLSMRQSSALLQVFLEKWRAWLYEEFESAKRAIEETDIKNDYSIYYALYGCPPADYRAGGCHQTVEVEYYYDD